MIVCLVAPMSSHANLRLYDGIDSQVDVFQLRSRFPESKHEFWSSSGKIYVAADGRETFEFFLRSDKGRYIVRLSQGEVFDDVYLIDVDVESGQAKRVRLSFEKPANLVADPINSLEDSHYRRHPYCEKHKAELVQLLGAPTEKQPWAEESIYHRPYQWLTAEMELTLECYQLDRKGEMLAESVEFKRK